MPIKILMPALSPTMTEGTIAKWLVKEGAEVSSGDVVCEIETDKATMEVETIDDGIVGKILIPEGTGSVAVNSPIAILLAEGEDPANIEKESSTNENFAPQDNLAGSDNGIITAIKKNVATISDSMPKQKNERIFASPLARRMARESGLDLNSISGSGPNGRILKRDIEVTTKTPQKELEGIAQKGYPEEKVKSEPSHQAIPNSSMRKTIAARLTTSARDIPHFNVTSDVDIGQLINFRKKLNGDGKKSFKISINDFIVKASAIALIRVPECNVSFTDDAILMHRDQDISIAVSVKGGLITPIIRNVSSKGLSDISNEIKELASRAKQGTLKSEEYLGGTFTISNLGMYGVRSFNSIINSPQGAILSVGAGEERPVVKNNALAIASIMTLTLAVDHRCIDGVVAASFMKELKNILEEPVQLML